MACQDAISKTNNQIDGIVSWTENLVFAGISGFFQVTFFIDFIRRWIQLDDQW